MLNVIIDGSAIVHDDMLYGAPVALKPPGQPSSFGVGVTHRSLEGTVVLNSSSKLDSRPEQTPPVAEEIWSLSKPS